jgi:hypothetical protein
VQYKQRERLTYIDTLPIIESSKGGVGKSAVAQAFADGVSKVKEALSEQQRQVFEEMKQRDGEKRAEGVEDEGKD